MTTPGSERQGSRADKPLEPWEQPGCFRRDCEPHRGNLLWWMALISVTCSTVGLGVPALPLTLATWRLARQDLRRMRAGTTDPAGEECALFARYLCAVALLFAGLHALVVLIILFGEGLK